MDNIKLYEKVKQYKREGLEDSVIIMRLVDKETSLPRVLRELEEYDFTKKMEKDIDEWIKVTEIDTSHNEYGIPMIKTDEDW